VYRNRNVLATNELGWFGSAEYPREIVVLGSKGVRAGDMNTDRARSGHDLSVSTVQHTTATLVCQHAVRIVSLAIQ